MGEVFGALREEAELPEFRKWRPVLRHLVSMHEGAMYENPRCAAPHPLETLGSGYCFGPAFGHWDLVFALLDSCPVMPEHTLRQLENMLFFQQEDGFLPGAVFFRGEGDVPPPHWYSTFPPVWLLAVDEYTKFAHDDRAVRLCYRPLLKQIAWFEANRRADGFGFAYLDMFGNDWESGVDESLRCELVPEKGRFPNIDATAQMRLVYDAAARWAVMLGEDGADFARRRAELDETIQTRFFSDETGFFHDAHLLARGFKYRALTGVWALTAGAATPEQADRVIGHLLEPTEFFTEHPLPFIAANEPGFSLRMWRGGAWNSMTWMAILGCLRYGRTDAARKIAEKALERTQIAYLRTGSVWEFYHPHGGLPAEMARKRAPWLLPCREYLGHNPLFAFARLLAGK